MLYRRESKAKAAAAVVFIIALIPVAVTVNGYVLSVFWRWFVVASFPGIAELSVPAAIGIATMIQAITYRHDLAKEKGEGATIGDLVLKSTSIGLVIPACLLGFGWIIKGFM